MNLKASALLYVLLTALLITSGCKENIYTNVKPAGRAPDIEPDYSGVTIPVNIAPMNFKVIEAATSYIINIKTSDQTKITIKSHDGKVNIPIRSWKRLLSENKGGRIEFEVITEDTEKNLQRYDPVVMQVSVDPIDPVLCYRLLYPGYESWVEMQIVERSTEDFAEKSLIENQLLKDNCVNCHSFMQNNPDRFLVHARGSVGGTYFVENGKITRRSLRTENMKANAVYPAWHPSGRYVAFSSNKTVQSFHMQTEKNIEVTDMFSSLLIYDIEKNGMFDCPPDDTVKYMETFPNWSPDGKYLYYCRTEQVKEGYNYLQVKYDLIRRAFDAQSGTFGSSEIIFNAHERNKSVSFPAVSPDGKYLVFTLHDYGTFSIWHKEADLYLLNLQTMHTEKMSLNSSETESYHSWSSNGKWLVFSSKREDGLTARPYFAFFGSADSIGKPFVLPQKDPELYKRLAKTFNRPELVSGKISVGPRDFMKASRSEAVKAKWTGK